MSALHARASQSRGRRLIGIVSLNVRLERVQQHFEICTLIAAGSEEGR